MREIIMIMADFNEIKNRQAIQKSARLKLGFL